MRIELNDVELREAVALYIKAKFYANQKFVIEIETIEPKNYGQTKSYKCMATLDPIEEIKDGIN